MWNREHPDGLHRSYTINCGCAIALHTTGMVSACKISRESAVTSLTQVPLTPDSQVRVDLPDPPGSTVLSLKDSFTERFQYAAIEL